MPDTDRTLAQQLAPILGIHNYVYNCGTRRSAEATDEAVIQAVQQLSERAERMHLGHHGGKKGYCKRCGEFTGQMLDEPPCPCGAAR